VRQCAHPAEEIVDLIYDCASILFPLKEILRQLGQGDQTRALLKFKEALEQSVLTLEKRIQKELDFIEEFKRNNPLFLKRRAAFSGFRSSKPKPDSS
jgi:hypothetical protein